MADYLIKQLRMAISAAVESTFNTTPSGAFWKFVTTSKNFYVQSAEKFDDKGKIGLGNDLPNVQFTGYLNPVTMEIADSLDTFIHPMLIRRAFGQAETVVAGSGPASGTFVHSFKVAPQITNPISSTMLWGMGGADKAWNGVTVNSIKVSGNRSEQPQFSATLVGTGKGSAVGSPTINAYVVPNYLDGAETTIFYTKDSTLTNLADRDSSTRRVVAWDVSLNNNNKTDDKRPGDPRVNANDPSGGHYINTMLNGEREVMGGITITLDGTAQEVIDSLADEVLTDFTISTKGKFIGSTTIQYGVDFIFPKCYLNCEEGVDDNGLAVIRATIKPVYESVSDTILKVAITNSTATCV